MSLSPVDRRPRRGVILVIVVACLALFMTVGIAFVFYANQQAISMRFQREASNGGRAANVNQVSRGNADDAPPQAVELFNLALGQLIYGAPDSDPATTTGTYKNFSAMNGHELARAMYGYNSTTPAGNTTPYNGFGRVHTTPTDEYDQLNYVYSGSGTPRRPEWESGHYISKNAPYTYPDENNCYLAAVNPQTGKVLVPSFHRPWLTGSNFTSANKLKMLRPNVTDNPQFPAPIANADGSYGDVENLEGKLVRQYDSMWIDLDAPVQTWRGRKYKPMFAFLIVDADGRINTNTAGNVRSSIGNQTSNQGWGPWEVDLDTVIPNGTAKNLLVSGVDVPLKPLRRYGSDELPNKIYRLDADTTNSVPPGTAATFQSGVDFDGSPATASGASPARMRLPSDFNTAEGYLTSPIWHARHANGSTDERLNHPLLYNPYFAPRANNVPIGWTFDDRSFGPNELYRLNHRLNGDESSYLITDQGQLSSRIANPIHTSTTNPRFMITPISNDLERLGTRPWRKPTDAGTYVQSAANALPTGGAIASPPLGAAPTSTTFTSEFDANWRSNLAALGSINLNRKLTDYRKDPLQRHDVDLGGAVINGTFNYAAALKDRQILAQDIFDRLCAATSAKLPGEAFPAAGTPAFDALRRLAQISVNIVDYIDNDDYMTWFAWNPLDPAMPRDVANLTAAEMPNRVVFGTEMSRLVINEAYANWDNDPLDPKPGSPIDNNNKPYADKDFRVGVWVELHNPLTPPGGTDANMSHSGGAPLVFKPGSDPVHPVYQLVITKDLNTTLDAANNVDGRSDAMPARTITVTTLGDLSDPAFMGVVPPSNALKGAKPGAAGQKGTNPSFYVIGPKNVQNLKAGDANATVPGNDQVYVSYEPKDSMNNSAMMWTVDKMSNVSDGPRTLLLRRLLCPHLAPNPDLNGMVNAGLPSNPYITVDYVVMASTHTHDHRTYIYKGTPAEGLNPNLQKFAEHKSNGRRQPYAGLGIMYHAQTSNPAPMAMEDTFINHSFYSHNSRLPTEDVFEWLVHLDRALISPPELLFVSAWKPHELHQRFYQGTTLGNSKPHQHLADWKNNDQRLYRALSFLETRNRTYGMPYGGRIPGKVNVNTIFDAAVFRSLCDPQSDTNLRGNQFTVGTVDTIGNNLLTLRSPTILGGNPWTATSLADKPFLPPAASYTDPSDLQLPSGGVQNTILGNNLLDVTTESHPYLKNELLTKIYNNLTTRSNTFIVYCTIGYFEVTNNGPFNNTTRPILGKELGIDDGSNIRHKFFAVVDRTNLTINLNAPPTPPATGYLQGERPVFLSYEPVTTDLNKADPDTTAVTTVTVRVPVVSGSASKIQGLYDGSIWTIENGTTIRLDVGPNAEDVTVASINVLGPGIGADVTLNLTTKKPHVRGCVMQIHPDRSQLGNPGPQPSFNYKDPRYKPVVPFVAQLN